MMRFLRRRRRRRPSPDELWLDSPAPGQHTREDETDVYGAYESLARRTGRPFEEIRALGRANRLGELFTDGRLIEDHGEPDAPAPVERR